MIVHAQDEGALSQATAPAAGDAAQGGVLVAGIGNIFLGDDGFGVEVVRRLAARELPSGVRVADFGIRGLHLALDLLDAREATAILVDATPRQGEPGTVYLIEPDLDQLGVGEGAGGAAGGISPIMDAHGMTPGAVFAMLRSLGGTPPRVWIVGCEPLRTEEEMGLSPPVERAVDEAVEMILDLLRREGAMDAPPKTL